MTRRVLVGISAITCLLISCGGLSLFISSPTAITPEVTSSPSPLPTEPSTVTPIIFPTHTPTLLPSETALPALTFTPTLTPEPQWVLQGPNQVIVPILLYHHIGFSMKDDSVY